MVAKEPQYDIQFETLREKGPVTLGPTASHICRSDPRHLGFLLARYKFCAKLLTGKSRVLEVGCGDAFGTMVVLQEVPFVHGIDFDPLFIDWASGHAQREGLNGTFSTLDITQEVPPGGPYDAAYALDLIEHLQPDIEDRFMENMCRALTREAVCIIGTPNIAASNHASKWSLEGHINLKGSDTLRALLQRYFHNVFIFSMNDEVVHTGYYPMAHYLMAVGVGVKT